MISENGLWRVTVRAVLFVLGLLLLAWLAVQLKSILVQVLLAIIISAGMMPVVDRFAGVNGGGTGRLRPPRALVVLLLYLTIIGAVVLIGIIAVPPVLREIEQLVSGLPHDTAELQQLLDTLPERYSFLPEDFSLSVAQQLRLAAGQFSAILGQALLVARLAVSLVSGTLNSFFTLILALYITVDTHRIVTYMVTFLPAARQQQARRLAGHIGLRLGGWVRGQILLSAIIGGVTLIGLSVLGVKYAFLLALVAAIGETVPMVGPIASAVPAVFIALLHSPGQGLLTLGLYVLIQQLENNLIVPKVMSRAVELHPLAVMLALLAGSELMGVTGAILAVPVTAALSVVIDEIRRERLAAEVQPDLVEAARAVLGPEPSGQRASGEPLAPGA